jgi:hypothetical protein
VLVSSALPTICTAFEALQNCQLCLLYNSHSEAAVLASNTNQMHNTTRQQMPTGSTHTMERTPPTPPRLPSPEPMNFNNHDTNK